MPATDTALQQSLEIVEALSDPSTYASDAPTVRRIETHISWLFLVGDKVYKLKKPVRLEFLDYSSLEDRRLMCELEVRLNRRLAPHVYQGVMAVTRQGDRYQVGGDGQVVDWLVMMTRLPAEAAMDWRLENDGLTADEVAGLADRLVRFYRHVPPAKLPTQQYQSRLIRLVLENADALQELCADSELRDIIQRTAGAQLYLLHAFPEQLERRRRDGRLVEGHGDLRPEHVYFVPSPVVIDGLEFSEELRQVDVLDELCFLEMECDALGEADVGRAVRERVQHALGDPGDPTLEAFYRCYRACVRAKVAWIRAQQAEVPAAPQSGDRQLASGACQDAARQSVRRYLELADRYAADLPAGPIVLVRGAMGSGKSTLAASLARQLGAVHLSTDELRRELLPGGWTPAAYGTGRYSRSAKRRIYEAMLKRANTLLDRGLSVVLDGSFALRGERELAHALAKRHARTLVQLHCQCPGKISEQRIVNRLATGQAVSEARPEWLPSQLDEMEPAETWEQEQTVSTLASPPRVLQVALQRIHSVARR